MQLRDHLVELRLRSAGTEVDVDIDAHRKAMKQALGDRFVTSCQRSISASELTCGLQANELRAATRCGASVSGE